MDIQIEPHVIQDFMEIIAVASVVEILTGIQLVEVFVTIGVTYVLVHLF